MGDGVSITKLLRDKCFKLYEAILKYVSALKALVLVHADLKTIFGEHAKNATRGVPTSTKKPANDGGRRRSKSFNKLDEVSAEMSPPEITPASERQINIWIGDGDTRLRGT